MGRFATSPQPWFADGTAKTCRLPPPHRLAYRGTEPVFAAATESKTVSMSGSEDDPPRVPVICEECATESMVPFPEVESTIDAHNERRHDGEPIAEIEPSVKSRLQDVLAEEMGLLD